MTSDSVAPRPEVSGTALAEIVAQAVAGTVGVAGPAPPLHHVVKDAVTGLSRRLTSQEPAEPERADPDAVEIDATDAGIVGITVRVVAGGNPPVLATVNAVQQAVTAAVRRLDGRPCTVTVLVVDVDPSG